MFKNKTLLITGGTGSFGHAVLNRFLESDLAEIRILSRDEKKQDDMRKLYSSQKIKFYIGDVRDIDSISDAIKDVNFIFHAAALKQVPSCEFYPLEAVKTNILGTENVLSAAISSGVERVVCLSTDKAVYPVNAMGTSKAMMEKVAIAKSRVKPETVITITRYGNVLASRGSVVPLFLEQIQANRPITITDPQMTRFIMTLEEAVDLVMHAFTNGNSGEIFVQKSPAATIADLAQALCKVLEIEGYASMLIGTRHGEKLFETLLSREEKSKAVDVGDYFLVPPDNRDLNYEKFIEQGEISLSGEVDFNSHNTRRLNRREIEILLSNLAAVKNCKRVLQNN